MCRDSDVEEYLRGILWTVQMYSDGFCPDVSYTYAGRPPVSPFLIVNYISKIVWKNCLLAGLEDFDLPSTVRHLFRSLYTQPNGNVSGKAGKTAIGEQLQKLQTLILGNRIGVGAGGVSWQELKSNVYAWLYSFPAAVAPGTPGGRLLKTTDHRGKAEEGHRNVRPGTTSGVGVVERNLAGVVQPRYHPSVLPVPERCRTRDPACATPVATRHMGCRTVSLGRRKPGYPAQQPASCLTGTGPPFKGARRGRPATGRPDGSGCRLGIRATSRPSEQPHA